MTAQFVRTKPGFTPDGAAYCPIERKRRGPAALLASMAVMFAGTGFLTLSVFSTPAPTADRAASRIVIPVQASTAPTGTISENEPASQSDLTIAPAGPTTISQNAPAGPMPRVKPVTVAAKQKKPDGLLPRLKPAAPAAAATTVIAARPMRLGGVTLASASNAPPPFFFESDLNPVKMARQPVALAYVSDIARDIGEAHIRITRGETFVDALKRVGISADDRNEAAYAFGKHYNLRRLQVGQEFVLKLSWPNQTLFQLASATRQPEARLLGLEFRSDPENRIVMRRSESGTLEAEKAPIALTTRTVAVAGRIDGSLYLSAKSVGAPDQIIADLADAFSYDVDFQREIRGGDEFEAIFEVQYDDRGELVSTGDILFARLSWRGRAKEKGYYRFTANADGGRADYYDVTGQSAKRLLMKTPIDGARLSSGFGTRKHPILGYRRAHKGVDFAARRGTPIKAAGDGVVERANRYGSFGNYIRIRHANGYKTAYAHLNGFARGIRSGRRVDQGDIIGYVGTTGRSTGPHLHYEVHLNGTAVNPQRLKIAATGKNLKGADLDRFKAHRDMINAMREPPEDEPDLLAKDDRAARNAL
ncbi:MAG: peptidoglycan DD-metalloendopeptidase family protein [Pseudomonadota bacterium]